MCGADLGHLVELYWDEMTLTTTPSLDYMVEVQEM